MGSYVLIKFRIVIFQKKIKKICGKKSRFYYYCLFSTFQEDVDRDQLIETEIPRSIPFPPSVDYTTTGGRTGG